MEEIKKGSFGLFFYSKQLDDNALQGIVFPVLKQFNSGPTAKGAICLQGTSWEHNLVVGAGSTTTGGREGLVYSTAHFSLKGKLTGPKKVQFRVCRAKMRKLCKRLAKLLKKEDSSSTVSLRLSFEEEYSY